MNKKPFFSVVVPTKNRAHLLPLALSSVLNQSFGDFEVIISDNFSSDETPAVAQSFDDKRIKYFRSEEPLSIGNSFHFALSHAKGEYIAFLSDDDAFVPVMFERVKRVIEAEKAEIVVFRGCSYYHNGDIAFNRQVAPNTLAISQFTGEVTKFDTAQATELLYSLYGLNNLEYDDRFIVSFLANAVYHNSVFARVKAVKSNPFATTPADLYLAAAVFFVTDWYYCLDEPLYIWSNWADNATASAHKKGDKLREHYEKLLNGEKLQFTPLKFALPQNCYVNTILQAKYDFENQAEKTKIDWVEYYSTVYDDLIYLKNLQINVTRELTEFDKTLACESAELQQQVKARTGNFSFASKQFLRKFPLVLRLGKRLIRRRKSDKPILISGEASGFSDVLGAADFLLANLLRK